MIDDPLLEQTSRLCPVFKERRAEVDIKYVESSCVDANVRPQTPAGFTASGAEVVIAVNPNGMPRQYDVAVTATFEAPRFPKREMKTEFFGNEANLICLTVAALDAQNFLQRNDVRIDFVQDVDNPTGADSTI